MAAVVLACALAIGIAVGAWVGAMGVCLAAGMGLVVSAWLFWAPCGPRRSLPLLAIAAACLGIVSSQVAPEASVPRGQPSDEIDRDLVVARVLEPAWPGPTCDVALETPRGPRRVGVHTDCDLRRGDVLWIRAATLTSPSHPDPFVMPERAPAWLDRRRRVGPNRLVDLRRQAYETGRSDPGWGLIGAALLGHRRALSPDARAQLSRSGLGHLVAISGLHVGLFGAGLWRLADRMAAAPRGLVVDSRHNRLRRWARAMLMLMAACAVAAYVWGSGHGAPAVRASLGLGLVPLARWRGKGLHPPTALGVVAIAMMIVDPPAVTQASFQLSFAAMAAIVRPGVQKTAWNVSRDIGWATSGIAVFHFGSHALWGMVINLVAIPVFAACLVPWSLVGAALSQMGVALASLFWTVAHGASRLLCDLARLGAALPSIPVEAAVVVGALWVSWARPGRGPPRLGVLALAIAGLVSRAGDPRRPGEHGPRSVAFGASRAPGVVIVDEGEVCVAGTGPGAGRWGARLDALDVGRADVVVLDAPLPPPPHWVEAAQAIRASGWEVEFRACSAAQRRAAEEARAQLRACRGRFGPDSIHDDAAAPIACVDGILGSDV